MVSGSSRDASSEAVAGAVRSLLRAARTLRTYPADNEISQRALAALRAQLTPLFPLRLELQTDQILVDSAPMLDERDRSDLVTALYADGIRRFDLDAGLESGELERFVQVLATPIHPDDLSEDYVTHLWEAELSHVRVAAVDPYLDLALPEDVLEGKEKPTGDSEDVGRVDEAPLPPPPDEAFRIEESDRLGVARDIEAAAGKPLWSPFVEALFETLRSPVGARRPGDVIHLIEACFQRLVAEQRLPEAERLLEQLAARPPESARPLLRSAIGRMVDPERLAPLHEALEEESCDRKAVARLFARMRPFACESACVFLARARSERTRRFYMDLLVHLGRQSVAPVLEHFATAQSATRAGLAHVLGRLRAAEAVPVLLAALPSAETRLRREITRSLATIRGPKAMKALLTLGLEDPDPRTRVIALRGLGRARAGLDSRRLLERIRSTSFATLSEEEKDLLFAALSALDGPGSDRVLVYLGEILSPSWWQPARRKAEWPRAAEALARLGTPDAVAILRRGAARRRRGLAAVCRQALEKLPKEVPS